MAAARAARAAGAAAGRMAAWRAHAYGPPGELRLESARVPALRAPDDVLVRVHHASVNPLDVAMIGGYGWRVLNALRALDGQGVEFPLVVGRDFAGEVAAAGAGAAARPGARVWGVVPAHRAGSHAQYVLVKDRWVGPAPRALRPAEAGGALYAALSACAVLRAAGLRPGRPPARRRAPRVLLLGLGGAGHAALQLLVHQGAQVVVGCSAELSERALGLGATAALDRAAPDYDAHLEDAGPYDAIVDCAGLGGEEAAARRWRFGCFATLTSPLLRETDARGLAPGAVAAAAALGAQCAALPPAPPAAPAPACLPRVRWAYFMPLRDDIEMLHRLAERGKFSVCVERQFAWRAAGAALARAAAGRARGKLVIDFTADAAE